MKRKVGGARRAVVGAAVVALVGSSGAFVALADTGGSDFHTSYAHQPEAVQRYLWGIGNPGVPFPDGSAVLHDAFNSYQAAIAEAEATIASAAGLSPQERAEGYSYLTGLQRRVLDDVLGNPDTSHPYFIHQEDQYSKWGGDNADNLYSRANIDDHTDYVITGRRGDAADMSFQVLSSPEPGDGSAGGGPSLSSLSTNDLKIDADGTFQIIVSATKHDGNWLASGPGASYLLFRQSFNDYNQTPAFAEIHPLNPTPPSAPVTPDLVALHLTEAGRLLVANVKTWMTIGKTLRALPAGTFTKPAPTQGGLPGQYSSAGHYTIAGDQALIVTVPRATALYAGIALYDAYQFITFDYRTRQASLPSGEAVLSPDGNYRYVISAIDPGVPNWLDTDGHPDGLIVTRWQGLTGPAPAAITTTVVPIDQVKSALAGEPTVTPAQRDQALARRAVAIARRFF